MKRIFLTLITAAFLLVSPLASAFQKNDVVNIHPSWFHTTTGETSGTPCYTDTGSQGKVLWVNTANGLHHVVIVAQGGNNRNACSVGSEINVYENLLTK